MNVDLPIALSAQFCSVAMYGGRRRRPQGRYEWRRYDGFGYGIDVDDAGAI